MGNYKCPVCSITADIDKEKKKITINLPPTARIFPTHPCELAKAIDVIDLSKLEKVD